MIAQDATILSGARSVVNRLPKSTLATINQFVDQYINKLIPASTRFNVSYIFGSGAAFE